MESEFQVGNRALQTSIYWQSSILSAFGRVVARLLLRTLLFSRSSSELGNREILINRKKELRLLLIIEASE